MQEELKLRNVSRVRGRAKLGGNSNAESTARVHLEARSANACDYKKECETIIRIQH